MYNWISPHTVIPVHGEYRHMVEQVNFAKTSGIKNQLLIQNGDVIKKLINPMRISLQKCFLGGIC